MKNQEIYNSFYNADESFRGQFENIEAFNEYVGDDMGAIEELKDIYEFEEAVPEPTDPPVKKKEDFTSELSSDGGEQVEERFIKQPIDEEPESSRFIRETDKGVRGGKPKVYVGPIKDDIAESLNNSIEEYERVREAKSKIETPGMYAQAISAPVQFITSGLMQGEAHLMWLSGNNDDYLKPKEKTPYERDIEAFDNELAGIESDIKANVNSLWTGASQVITEKEQGSESLSSYLWEEKDRYMNEDGVVVVKEFNRDTLDRLTMLPESSLAKGINGEVVKYNRVPDDKEVEAYLKERYEESELFVLRGEKNDWTTFRESNSYKIIKQSLVNDIEQGLTQTAIVDIMNDKVEDLKTEGNEDYNKVVEQINYRFEPIANEINDKYSAQINQGLLDIQSKYEPEINVVTDVQKQAISNFDSKYTPFFNTDKKKYEFQTQEQMDEFLSDANLLQDAIAESNQQLERINNSAKSEFVDFKRKIKNAYDKDINGAYDFLFKEEGDPLIKELFKDLRKESIAEYASLKQGEKDAVRDQGVMSYYGNILAKTWYDKMQGMSILLDKFGGGSNAMSRYFDDVATNAVHFDNELYNPTAMREGESWKQFGSRIAENPGEFLKESVGVVIKSGEDMAFAIGVGEITGNQGLAASIAFVGDTAMEVSEAYNTGLAQTGSVSKAYELAGKQWRTQTLLMPTYSWEMGIFLNKTPIKTLAQGAYLTARNTALDTGVEFTFQESAQSYFLAKNVWELTHPEDQPFEGKYTDYMDKRTFVDVAIGSGGLSGTFGALNTGVQLKRQSTMVKTLQALEKKGLSALVENMRNDLGENGAKSVPYQLYMSGKIDKNEYRALQTTVSRLIELGEVAEGSVTDEGRRIAMISLMSDRSDLMNQKEQAQTEEKKKQIDELVKKIDEDIEIVKDEEKDVDIAVVKDNTGKIVYATTSDRFMSELAMNQQLATNLFAGIGEGTWAIDSKNKKVDKFVNAAASTQHNMRNFYAERRELQKDYAKKRAAASKARNSNKKNTPSDADLKSEFDTKLAELANKYAVPEQIASQIPVQQETQARQEMAQGEPQTEPQVTAKEKKQVKVPKALSGKVAFDAINAEELDALIEENKDDDIAQKVLSDVKRQLQSYKSLFPNGKIIVHTDQKSFEDALFEETKVREEGVTDDGFFSTAGETSIHINLSDTNNVENLEVVSHEIVHAAIAKAFGEVVIDPDTGQSRIQVDPQVLTDMKNIVDSVVGKYGRSLDEFLKGRAYGEAETAEEFLVQLGALGAAAKTPLEQSFVASLMTKIAEFVKDKIGVDIFQYYTNQKNAIDFLNYISKSLAEGNKFDESKFEKVQGGFMVPKEINPEDAIDGNYENGTIQAVSRRSKSLTPILDQFSKREGTVDLAYDLPVYSLQEKIKEHEGAVMLITSDNTGFTYNEETGLFVMGGYGYMAAKKNIDNNIGFASVNIGTVKTAVSIANEIRNGEPVLVLINLSSPKSSLGNYYAANYTFGSIPSKGLTAKQAEELKTSIINYALSTKGIMYNFGNEEDVSLARKAFKENDQNVFNPLIEKFRAKAEEKFIKDLRQTDFNSPESVEQFIKTFTDPSVSFKARQSIINAIVPKTSEDKITAASPQAKKIMADLGLSQLEFHNKFGEPFFVGDKMIVEGSKDLRADWGSVFGGFTLDPKADYMAIQDKGLVHPQFNAKLPGYNQFLLDGEYGVNQNFGEAMKNGSVPVAQQAAQSIFPGTRLPDTNTDPNALTTEERRALLLNSPIVKRSLASDQKKVDTFKNLADQFAARLNTAYELDFNDTADRKIYSIGYDGKITFHMANVDMSAPIYAYTGVFIEMIKNQNITQYTNMLRSALRDKNSQLYKDVASRVHAKSRSNLKVLQDAGLETGGFEVNKILEQDPSGGLLLDGVLKNKPNLGIDIESTGFIDILNDEILFHMSEFVQDKYDMDSGIYNALKDIWDKIVEMIKSLNFANKINLDQVNFNNVEQPIWHFAEMLADPRNAFEADAQVMAQKQDPDILEAKEYAKRDAQYGFNTVYKIKDPLLGYKDYLSDQNIEPLLESSRFLIEDETIDVNPLLRNPRRLQGISTQFVDWFLQTKARGENSSKKIGDWRYVLDSINDFKESNRFNFVSESDRAVIDQYADFVNRIGAILDINILTPGSRRSLGFDGSLSDINRDDYLFDFSSETFDNFYDEYIDLAANQFSNIMRGLRPTSEAGMRSHYLNRHYTRLVFHGYGKENLNKVSSYLNEKEMTTLRQPEESEVVRVREVHFSYEENLNNWLRDEAVGVKVSPPSQQSKVKGLTTVNNVDFNEFVESLGRKGTSDKYKFSGSSSRSISFEFETAKREEQADGTFVEVPEETRKITYNVEARIASRDTYGARIYVAFTGDNSYATRNLGSDVFALMPKVISSVFRAFPDINIKEVSFTPIEGAADAKKGRNMRRGLYNTSFKRAVAPFYLDDNASGSQDVIIIPSFLSKEPVDFGGYNEMGVTPLYRELVLEDVDQATSTYSVKRSRSSKINENKQKIDSDYQSMMDQGIPEEEALANLFTKYGYESMRYSNHGSKFMSQYDSYVTSKALEAWDTHSNNWNKRQQGIIDFVDKYIVGTGLDKIIQKLRDGVLFVQYDGKYLPEGDAKGLTDNQGRPIEVPEGEKIKFTDTELYTALFTYGVPQKALDSIFGPDYRRTIENMVTDPQFDSTVKEALTDDARSFKLTMSMEELSDRAEEMSIMESEAIINYINKHLSTATPTLPALKKIIDKIRKARDFNDVGTQLNEIKNEINTSDANNIQAISELASFAGRVLRIVRELNSKTKGEIITDHIKSKGIAISPAFEQQIKNAVAENERAKSNFEKARENFFKDFTDENAKILRDADIEYEKAQQRLAIISADPRLQFRFASQVLTRNDALALLSTNTVFLSIASNIEALLKRMGFVGRFFRKAADRMLPSGRLGLKSELGLYSKNDRANLYRRMYQYSAHRSWRQTKDSFLKGQLPDSKSSKFYDQISTINSFRDASNLVSLFRNAVTKFSARENMTTEEFADTMQAMMIQMENGDYRLADGKLYSVVGSLMRATLGFLPEVEARLMPLGADRFTSNAVAMHTLLEYVSLSQNFVYEGMPLSMMEDIRRRASEPNNSTTLPAVQPESDAVLQKGSNDQTEMRNLALMMETILRDREDPFYNEGLRATFFADNFISRGAIGSMRKKIKSLLNSTYQEALKAKSKGKRGTEFAYRTANVGVQVADVFQWSLFPFVTVPSNIILQILARTNPAGALVSSTYRAYMYNQSLKDFYKKYGITSKSTSKDSQSLPSGQTDVEVYTGDDISSPTVQDDINKRMKEMSFEERMNMEKDLADLYVSRKRLVQAIGDIPTSSALMYGMYYLIAASGAVIASDADPEKIRVLEPELGYRRNSINTTYLREWLSAKAQNPSLTGEEFYKKRGGFKPGDGYMDITNLGTYTSYTIGYLTNLYEKQKVVGGDANKKTEGMHLIFDAGTIASAITGSTFKQTPSIKTVSDFLKSLENTELTATERGGEFLSNVVGASGAFLAPSLLGSPYSKMKAEKTQSMYDVKMVREEGPNMGGLLTRAHMKLSRNGFLGLGMMRSEYYKNRIGTFGEDLSQRRTISEPNTFLSYMESTINFPSYRKETMLDPEYYGNEADKHRNVRQFVIDYAYMADVYGNLGGDANKFWSILDRQTRNKFVLTASNTEENENFILPNDMYRDELRIKGEYRYQAIKNYENNGRTMASHKELIKNSKTDEEAKRYIEEALDGLQKTLQDAEAQYKEDFLSGRNKRVIRTMKDRGLLTDRDMNVLKDYFSDTDLINVLESAEQPKWEPKYRELNK